MQRPCENGTPIVDPLRIARDRWFKNPGPLQCVDLAERVPEEDVHTDRGGKPSAYSPACGIDSNPEVSDKRWTSSISLCDQALAVALDIPMELVHAISNLDVIAYGLEHASDSQMGINYYQRMGGHLDDEEDPVAACLSFMFEKADPRWGEDYDHSEEVKALLADFYAAARERYPSPRDYLLCVGATLFVPGSHLNDFARGHTLEGMRKVWSDRRYDSAESPRTRVRREMETEELRQARREDRVFAGETGSGGGTV